MKVVKTMANLIYDETSLVQNQMYKYDQFLHSRVNKYTGSGRTLVTYFNLNDANTTDSLGMGTHYQIIGPDSPLRYDEIERMVILGFSPLAPQNEQVSQTQVRDYALNGEGFIIPGTIMPKENDFFIVNHLNMNHLFRVTEVTQDGLNTDGSYRIAYSLHSTNPIDIRNLRKQVVTKNIMDLQTIGGSDLTPVIGKEDYELRSNLIRMVDDMVENYKANYYDHTHNCFLLHLNGRTLFDVCANMFMARNGVMIRDNANGNVVLNENKIRDYEMDAIYQRSPFKWIERDAPLRYLMPFKYRLVDAASTYPESSFARYGADVQVMIPGDAWCKNPGDDVYFPMDVYNILESEMDPRECDICDCQCCKCKTTCIRAYKLHRYDYISLIHDYIHGRLQSIHDLSVYTGDPLFDNAMSQDVFLWTPMIIYIIKQTLKNK
jgi:hypothetical protein